jgi:CRP-like cAMP-binding protein
MQNNNELLFSLSQSMFFRDINSEKREYFLNSSEQIFFDKGKMFSDTELRSHIFIPVTGRVKSYQVNPHTGKEYTIFLFHSGDVFDIVTFIDQHEHEVLFEVTKGGLFLKISHELLDIWIKDEPQINANILFLLSHMLSSVEQNASDLALYDTFTRLSKLIVRHVCSKPLATNIKTKVRLKHIDTLSHEEMAQLIGTAREVVSRHIKLLKEKKILETSKKKHHIVNLEALLEHCHLPHKC